MSSFSAISISKPRLTHLLAVSIFARCSREISSISASSFCEYPFSFLYLKMLRPNCKIFVVLLSTFLFYGIVLSKYVVLKRTNGVIMIGINKLIKKGFTLAEVLITLGIIGVVAAMTIPSLIGKKGRPLIGIIILAVNLRLYLRNMYVISLIAVQTDA